MNDQVSSHTETLPLLSEREIDAVCLRFEAAWQTGPRPRIEDYLANTAEPTRPALLGELLRLELEYRLDNSEQPIEAEYACRFPGSEASIVEQVFAAVSRSALPQVPGYDVLAELGRGGMGVVYKAWQIKADRFVALKMVLAGEMASADEIARFTAEARAVAGLDHPNIVPIYEVGEHAGRHYFTMKLVPDSSLAEQIAHSPLPSRRAAEIVQTVARAVHYAHQQNVIHRDLKPANILLDRDGQPHVTDFGLAKRLDGKSAKTRTGAVIGTPGYMAAEQAASGGKEPTAATDVYGLGAVLYALLTGRPPFQAETLLDTLMQVVNQPPAPPRLLNPNIDENLETICLKCLEKEPAERYPTAEKLAQELDRYLRGEPIEARPPSWLQNLSRQFGKRREVLDPLSWSYISFFGAAVTFCTHLAIFWITQPEGPINLFAPCVCLNGLLAGLITWHYLLRRRTPFTPDERHIAVLYGYFVSTAFVLYATTYPWNRDDILTMYPALALLTGVYQLVLARLYWGPLYLNGLAYYLLAFVMKLKPEWAPLEFAVVSAIHNMATGVFLRRAVNTPTDEGKT